MNSRNTSKASGLPLESGTANEIATTFYVEDASPTPELFALATAQVSDMRKLGSGIDPEILPDVLDFTFVNFVAVAGRISGRRVDLSEASQGGVVLRNSIDGAAGWWMPRQLSRPPIAWTSGSSEMRGVKRRLTVDRWALGCSGKCLPNRRSGRLFPRRSRIAGG